MVSGCTCKYITFNFLGYAHWFISIRISQLKDHYISMDQARYATSIVSKYLDTAAVKVSKKFYKTTLVDTSYLVKIMSKGSVVL